MNRIGRIIKTGGLQYSLGVLDSCRTDIQCHSRQITLIEIRSMERGFFAFCRTCTATACQSQNKKTDYNKQNRYFFHNISPFGNKKS